MSAHLVRSTPSGELSPLPQPPDPHLTGRHGSDDLAVGGHLEQPDAATLGTRAMFGSESTVIDATHGEDVAQRAARARSARLYLTLGLTSALVVVQVAVGLSARSIGVLSDAGHNVTDLVAIAVSLVAVKAATRPRTDIHSFGFHRGSILAALVNAATIAVATVLIAAAGIGRLLHPRPVHGAEVITVALVALACNGIAAVALRSDGGRTQDLNMRAALLHMAGDALASLAVLVSGIILVADPALDWADPAASLAVAAIIVIEAVRLMRDSVEVLLEAAPRDVDLDNLKSALRGVAGVDDVHDLHVWSLSSDVRALSAHVTMQGHPTLEEAQAVGGVVRTVLTEQFAIAHCTLELECESCEQLAR